MQETRYIVKKTHIFHFDKLEIVVFPTEITSEKSYKFWLNKTKINELINEDLTQIENDRFNTIDVLVNSANNYLLGGSGIAKDLDLFLGGFYKEKCKELLIINGNKLEKGRSYFISFPRSIEKIEKGIIQSISIHYSDYESGYKIKHSNSQDIYNCVFSLCEILENLNYKSVAIPQMASREGYSIYNSKNAVIFMINNMINAIFDFKIKNKNSSVERIWLHPKDKFSENYLQNLLLELCK